MFKIKCQLYVFNDKKIKLISPIIFEINGMDGILNSSSDPPPPYKIKGYFLTFGTCIGAPFTVGCNPDNLNLNVIAASLHLLTSGSLLKNYSLILT